MLLTSCLDVERGSDPDNRHLMCKFCRAGDVSFNTQTRVTPAAAQVRTAAAPTPAGGRGDVTTSTQTRPTRRRPDTAGRPGKAQQDGKQERALINALALDQPRSEAKVVFGPEPPPGLIEQLEAERIAHPTET